MLGNRPPGKASGVAASGTVMGSHDHITVDRSAFQHFFKPGRFQIAWEQNPDSIELHENHDAVCIVGPGSARDRGMQHRDSNLITSIKAISCRDFTDRYAA